MRVQGLGAATNLPPVIGNVTQAPAAPTHAEEVTITAKVTDEVGIASVTLNYSPGSGGVLTNTVFAETMATTAVKPWTGTGCDNVWVVYNKESNPFEQAANANYSPGGGNSNGLSFKNGTTNLSDSMITTSNGINAQGTSGTIGFYIQASIVKSNAAWTLQVNPGSGFTTRLSGETTTNQSWHLCNYPLESGDLVSNLLLRFQFSEGFVSNRIFLDQISVKVVTGGSISSNIVMSLVSNDIYAAQIPAQTNGARVSYVITALDTFGLGTITGGSYQVSDVGAFPEAAFTAAPTNGGAPLEVVFTDTSTGSITNRFWSFGDGYTTNTAATNLTHTYDLPGTSTVQLIVWGPLGLSTNTHASLIQALSVDTVGDGIPDWWRAQYFGGGGRTTNSQSCTIADPDQDNMNNTQEFLADTNPTNNVSLLALVDISPQASGAWITWIGGIAVTQVVECRHDLGNTQEQWSAVYTNIPPTAVTKTILHSSDVSTSNTFYRVKAWR